MSRPGPTEHLSPASLASSSPAQELNSARVAQTWKRPPLLAKALPTRPTGSRGSPSGVLRPTHHPFAAPSSCPPLRKVPSSPRLPQRPSTLVPPPGPSALARRAPPSRDHSLAKTPAPHLFPAPTPAAAPAPPPPRPGPTRPTWRRLPLAFSHLPPSGAGPHFSPPHPPFLFPVLSAF